MRYKATGQSLPREIINVEQLSRFQDGERITPERLKELGVIRTVESRLKLLGDGSLTKRVTILVHAASESAKTKVEHAGGTVELIR